MKVKMYNYNVVVKKWTNDEIIETFTFETERQADMKESEIMRHIDGAKNYCVIEKTRLQK